MKSLHDYLIQEKLHLNDKIKIKDEIKIPEAVDDNTELSGKIWKVFPLDTFKKWLIYADAYHANLLHFGELGDFLMQLVTLQNDWEDFDPTDEKCILYQSDNLKEAFDWYVNKLGLNAILKMKEFGDIVSYVEEYWNKNKKPCYDSAEFFANVKLGDWTKSDLDYLDITEDDLLNWPHFVEKNNFDSSYFPEEE